MEPRSLTTTRTAHYLTLGDPPVEEVWMACHGYGQLARYFARPFEAIARPGRLIVVPEALGRFYLDSAHQRVGASWMTREARNGEIADYVAWLDTALSDALERADADLGAVRFVTLGFSQGTATITRWLQRSPLLAARSPRADRLLLWGSGLPHDLDLHTALWLCDTDLTLVIGDEDEYATPERTAAQQEALDEAAVPYRLIRYAGGHRISPEVLARLVDEHHATDG